MMIRINLLAAHEVKREKNQKWFFQGILLSFFTLIAFFLIAYWMLGNQVQTLKKEKISLERQTA